MRIPKKQQKAVRVSSPRHAHHSAAHDGTCLALEMSISFGFWDHPSPSCAAFHVEFEEFPGELGCVVIADANQPCGNISVTFASRFKFARCHIAMLTLRISMAPPVLCHVMPSRAEWQNKESLYSMRRAMGPSTLRHQAALRLSTSAWRNGRRRTSLPTSPNMKTTTCRSFEYWLASHRTGGEAAERPRREIETKLCGSEVVLDFSVRIRI